MGGSSKKKRSKKQPKDDDDDEDLKNETRFAAAETHPQFRRLKPQESKVVLDERFSSVLTDPRFQMEGRDKYGRKNKKNKGKKGSTAKEELSSFYMVEEKDEEKEEQEKDAKAKKESQPQDDSSSEDSSDSSDSDSDDNEDSKEEEKTKEDPASRIAYLTALSRGELDESSSSDEDDSSQSSDDDDDDNEEGDPVYGKSGILDPTNNQADEVEISYDSSPYLVVQNMDWDHIRAVDLFSLLSSFTTMGSIRRVQVFQSDFGKERMEKDRLQGPSGIWKTKGTTNKPSNTIKKISEQDSDEESSSKGSAEDDHDDDDDFDDDSMEEEVQPINDNDFDPEKLRAYEASKLKYYFAIVEFASAEYADVAYREVDGMEFERSSAAIDLRTLPKEAYDEVVEGRQLRDEATSIPGNYEPPEFVVSALQQTSVECTWDQGDVERERKLTQYNSGGWQNMTETDDLQAYLASDGSSDEDDSEDDNRAQKSSTMRKLLGLESGSEDSGNSDSADSSDGDSDSDDNDEGMSKQIKYMPGQKDLEEKIRSKLKEKDQPKEELTPWEKYQEKRKQKRRERRQAARGRRNEPQGRKPEPQSIESEDESTQSGGADNDDFFVESDDDKPKKKNKQTKSKRGKSSQEASSKSQSANTAELELLLAGDNDEEQEKDFDIRGLQRIEKNKGKKLKGGRKRKEEKIAKDVAGTNFKVDVEDNRFAAVLDGSDGRFGIDKTDPNYKETAAMRDILAEQTKRRKKKRQKTKSTSAPAPDVSADSSAKTIGSNALSTLVQRLKTKVANQ